MNARAVWSGPSKESVVGMGVRVRNMEGEVQGGAYTQSPAWGEPLHAVASSEASGRGARSELTRRPLDIRKIRGVNEGTSHDGAQPKRCGRTCRG